MIELIVRKKLNPILLIFILFVLLTILFLLFYKKPSSVKNEVTVPNETKSIGKNRESVTSEEDVKSSQFNLHSKSFKKFTGKVTGGTSIIILTDRGNTRKKIAGKSMLGGDLSKRRIAFIAVNRNIKGGVRKKIISEIPYPYCVQESVGVLSSPVELRNLLENESRNLLGFLNIANSEDELCYMRIKFLPEKKELEIYKKLVGENGTLMTEGYYTDLNPEGTLILANCGNVIDVINKRNIRLVLRDDGREDEICFRGRPYKIADPPFFYHGAKFLNDNMIIYQGQMFVDAKDETPEERKFKKYPNLILLYQLNKPQDSKLIESGFTEINPGYNTNRLCPLDISPDEEKLAFQALYPDSSGKSLSLWLSVLHLKNDNQIEKICRLASAIYPDRSLNRGIIYKFNPDSKTNLIAVAGMNNIRLINIETKEVFKSLEVKDAKSIRWSYNGKKLGILKRAKFEYQTEKYSISRPASLWIYDLEKDKLEKIDEDPGYFDFFWVPEDGERF